MTDFTFGPLAQVTFPPGVLSMPTQVAIDVFLEPLDLPNPTGFQAPGTRFVNIDLNPEPTFPLPAPGLTIVLPLVNPMIPGARLDLFRVNPTTGMLEPSIGVDGLPVVGTVNSNGLSATFTGVARLSVVVAYIPEVVHVNHVHIDIKLHQFPNRINLGSHGTVPVAILSSATFDARTVDPLTVKLAGAPVKLRNNGTPMASFQDVNGGGFSDLVVHVIIEALHLTPTDTEAALEGKLFDGRHIRGTDSVRIVP